MKKNINAGTIRLHKDMTYKFISGRLETSTFIGAIRLIPAVLEIVKLNPSLGSVVLTLSPDISLKFNILNFGNTSKDSDI